MSLSSSRKKLVAVLALGVLLLAVPFLYTAWSNSRAAAGKDLAFDGDTNKDAAAVFKCLLQRPAGGLALDITTTNHFADTARGIAVEMTPREGGTHLRAWIAAGKRLSQGEEAQLKSCL